MIKKLLIDILKKELKGDVQLKVTPSPDLGDYCLECFKLSKDQPPEEFAKQLAKRLEGKIKIVKRIEAMGSYLNFFLNKSFVAGLVIKKILNQKEKYGSTNIGNGKKILIEHTSINPNASPHVGRARNAILGDSIPRLFARSALFC